jgi:hypothetical protein
VHFIGRVNRRNTFSLDFSENLKKRSTTDLKLLERTVGYLLNHFSTLIGIDSDFNYQSEVQKFEETNQLSVEEITNNEKFIELQFLAELKFNCFNTNDENEPFITGTTDEKIE